MKQVRKEWENVLERYGYPNLAFPSFVEDTGSTAWLDMKQKEITIDTTFLSDLGLGLDGFRAVCGHEVGHHVVFPYDLSFSMKVVEEMKKSDEANAKDLENLFSDVIVNTDMVDRGLTSISDVYKTFDSDNSVMRALKAVQSYNTNTDFGVANIASWKQKTKNMVRSLAKLNYRDLRKENILRTAYRFGTIITRHREEPLSDVETIDTLLETNISNGNLDFEIRKNPGGFNPEMIGEESKDSLLEYYKSKSRQYQIRVEDVTKTERTGEKISGFEVGDTYASLDTYKSFGKVLPGFSKKRESNTFGSSNTETTHSLEDLLICLDGSGSMTDPNVDESPAVISGFALANTYLRRGREVASLTFSHSTDVVDFTDDEDRIYNGLLRYEGGGTRFDYEKVESLLDRRPGCDCYVISDMQLDDIESFGRFLKRKKDEHDITVFHIDPFSSWNVEGVQCYSVSTSDEIPDMVRREVKKKV